MRNVIKLTDDDITHVRTCVCVFSLLDEHMSLRVLDLLIV